MYIHVCVLWKTLQQIYIIVPTVCDYTYTDVATKEKLNDSFLNITWADKQPV